MCPRLTWYLKTEPAEPLIVDPVHPPHIIGDQAEVHREGTGFEPADLGSDLSSILICYASFTGLSKSHFLVYKVGEILPDMCGSVKAK